MTRVAPPRRPLSRLRALAITLGLLVAIALGRPAVKAANRAVNAPWSIGWGGRDTLTGPWAGSLRARQGAEYGLYLHLEYVEWIGRRERNPTPSGRDNLRGRGILCTPAGERYEYSVSGRADRAGNVAALRLEYGDPALSALNLRMRGVWRQGALTLTPDANPFLPDGRFEPGRAVSSADPDDAFAPATLHGRERRAFEAACQQLRGTAARARACPHTECW